MVVVYLRVIWRTKNNVRFVSMRDIECVGGQRYRPWYCVISHSSHSCKECLVPRSCPNEICGIIFTRVKMERWDTQLILHSGILCLQKWNMKREQYVRSGSTGYPSRSCPGWNEPIFGEMKYPKLNSGYYVQLQSASLDGNKKTFCYVMSFDSNKIKSNLYKFWCVIQPLVDELQQLWSRVGVFTRDARAYMGMSQFNMRVVLMWTLHDFPAYGLISGLTTKGFKACPVCGPHTKSQRSTILRKNVYCNCHWRYLRQDHYFRGVDAAFDNEANDDIKKEPLTGNQTIRRGYESEAYLDSGGTEKDNEFPAKEHGVKRVSALYQLPYWRVSAMICTPCNLLVCDWIETTLISPACFDLLSPIHTYNMIFYQVLMVDCIYR